MPKEAKWEGCPYDVKKHAEELRKIAIGVMPDHYGSGYRYHTGRVQLAYEWLKKKKEIDAANGIYY